MTSNYSVHAITWNVGESDPPSDISPLFKFSGKVLPNIYVIGLQEMKSTSISMLADSFFNDPWTVHITDHLTKHNYIRLKSLRMMGTHLSLYILRDDLKHVTNLQYDFTRTAFAGFWGNKGAISLSLEIFGINICFVNSHFSAHIENSKQRIQDYNQIVLSQKFCFKEVMNILDHDYVFWIGDMNFRFDDLDRNKVLQLIQQRNYKELLKHDQLLKAKNNDQVFHEFSEGVPGFPPTYKYDYGTDNYDTSSKNRIPGWCDRMLWRVHEDGYEGVKLSVEQHDYTSVQQFINSDHKPVVSSFTIKVLSQSPSDVRVIFEPLGCWNMNKSNQVDYTVPHDFVISSNDWIGLYKEKHVSLEQYECFVWVRTEAGKDMGDGTSMYTAIFDKPQFVGLEDGYYQLIYHSHIHKCPAGISGPLKLFGSKKTSDDSDEESDVDGGLIQKEVKCNSSGRPSDTLERPETSTHGRRRPNYSSSVDPNNQNLDERVAPRQEINSKSQKMRDFVQDFQGQNFSSGSGSDDSSLLDQSPQHYNNQSQQSIGNQEDESPEIEDEKMIVVKHSDVHGYAEEYEQLRDAAMRERDARAEERMRRREDGRGEDEEKILEKSVIMNFGITGDENRAGDNRLFEESVEKELMERNLGGFAKAFGVEDEVEQEIMTKSVQQNVKAGAGDEGGGSEDECVEVKQSILLGLEKLNNQNVNQQQPVNEKKQISTQKVTPLHPNVVNKNVQESKTEQQRPSSMEDAYLDEALDALNEVIDNAEAANHSKDTTHLPTKIKESDTEIAEEFIFVNNQSYWNSPNNKNDANQGGSQKNEPKKKKVPTATLR